MSNQIDGNGIQIQTFSEILDGLINGTPDTPGIKQIYGDDVNVDLNSPDGQWINNLALIKSDILELCVQIYNAKDPDQAVGVDLDAVCQLCGITRKGGTYTEVPIVVNTDRALNLNGQDTSTPYTIEDSNGNQFQLIASAVLVSGDNTLSFRAVDIGNVQVIANTITTPTTYVLGVQGVNNPTGATQTGADQETDAQLRLRRQKSVSNAAQGFNPTMTGRLYELTGVVQVVVYENTTGTTNSDGVPSHSIWVIVDGGAVEEIAGVIYAYRNAGCGMHGGTSSIVVQSDGTSFEILFDRAVAENLYIDFSLQSLNGGTVDVDFIKEEIVARYSLGIYEAADITSVTAIVHEVDPTVIVSGCKVSKDGSTWFDSVLPSAKKNKFSLSVANISS